MAPRWAVRSVAKAGTIGTIDAYEQFDRREPGWMKVELEPAA